MLLLSDNFIKQCDKSSIYLDTNVFIVANENDDLLELLVRLKEKMSIELLTLSSVEFEYTRGSKSLKELQVRKVFVRNIVGQVLRVGKFLEGERAEAFSFAMSLVVSGKNSQYTDFLLAVSTLSFNQGIVKQLVLTTDSTAFPRDLFDIEGSVCLSRSNNRIQHLYLISANREKYTSLISTQLQSGKM